MSEQAKCELCGEPMPAGEEMVKYHGYSGQCPKPPLARGASAPAVSAEGRLLGRLEFMADLINTRMVTARSSDDSARPAYSVDMPTRELSAAVDVLREAAAALARPEPALAPAELFPHEDEQETVRTLRWLAQVVGSGRFREIQRCDGNDSVVDPLEPAAKTRIARVLNRAAEALRPAPAAEGWQPPWMELLAWAKRERDEWSERNADRYWQMNRVVAQIESVMPLPPPPTGDAT